MASRFRSIAAKLFYLTTCLVVVTVAGNSLQNALMFNKHVSRQVEESTIELAGERASVVDNILEHWHTEVSLLVHSLGLRATAKEREAELSAYMQADRDILALAIVAEPVLADQAPEISAVTDATKTAVFEGLNAADVLQRVKAAMPRMLAARLAKDSARHLLLDSLGSDSGLPVAVVMLPFSWEGEFVKGQTSVVPTSGELAPTPGAKIARQYWALMAVWMNKILTVLPKGEMVRSRLLTTGGHVLASHDAQETVSAGFPSSSLWAQAELVAAQASGLKSFKDPHGEEWLGAFAHLPGGEATLLVERNAKAQHLAADSIIRRSALWGWAFVLLAMLVSFAGAAGVTANLRALGKATREIADGNLEAAVNTKGADEVAHLGASVRHMASRIQTLLREQVKKAQMEKELETAQAVQNALFPKTTVGLSGRIAISSFYQSASQCGGDWWGWFATGPDSGFLCIGDATGHGAGSALVTALAFCGTFSATSAHASRQGPRSISPAALLAQLNDVMWASVGTTAAMTFFAVHFDLGQGTMTFANAGHNFPMLWPVDPEDDRRKGALKRGVPKAGGLGRAEPIYLGKGGIPLGLAPESTFAEYTLPIRRGDKILFYTDGLIECTNPNHEQWGKPELVRTLRSLATANAADLTTGVKDAALRHFDGQPPDDDVTLLVLEITTLSKEETAPVTLSAA